MTHIDDDGPAQGMRAIKMAVEARFKEIVADKWAARRKFDRQEQAARFILDGFDSGDWFPIAGEIAKRLTEEQRTGLLMCVIKSLPDDLTRQVLEGMLAPGLPASAGDYKEAADHWAEHASPAEIRAFVAAGIKAMPPETRQRMRNWLNK